MERGAVREESDAMGCLNIVGSLLLMLLSVFVVASLVTRAKADCAMLGELFGVEAETRFALLCQYQENGEWVELTLENLRDGS